MHILHILLQGYSNGYSLRYFFAHYISIQASSHRLSGGGLFLAAPCDLLVSRDLLVLIVVLSLIFAVLAGWDPTLLTHGSVLVA